MKCFTFVFFAVMSLFLLDFHQVKADSKNPKYLILTDSVETNMPTDGSIVNISNRGEKVFIDYLGGVEPPVPPGDVPAPPYVMAQLFNNNDGTLVLINQVFLDLVTFNSSIGGGASPDFSRFVIIDESDAGALRIRVFDSTLTNVIATARLDTPTNNAGLIDPHVAFTQDGNYFAILITTNFQSYLAVFATDTLALVTEQVLPSPPIGPVNAVSPTYFKVCYQEYFAIGVSNGSNPVPPHFPPLTMSNLEIFAFDRNASTLFLANETPLPQAPESLTALRFPKNREESYAIIAVGTDRADLADEIITFQVRQLSLLPKDGDELRLYKFDGQNTTLIASQNVKMDVTAAEPYPLNKGATLATSMRTLPTSFNPTDGSASFSASEIFQLKKIFRTHHGVSPYGYTNFDQTYSVGSEAKSNQFSLDGNWLVVGSCKGAQSGVVPPADSFLGLNHNLQLFRVVR